MKLTKEDLQNLVTIVASHPTPEGVGSPSGQAKVVLLNKLSVMLRPKPVVEKVTK